MELRFNHELFGYVIISIFIVIIMSAMWEFSVDYSERKSLIHGTFFSAAKWLSENFDENQTALLPTTEIFWSLDDSLMKRTKDYAEVWKLTGIFLQANITEAEILEARNHLREYIKSDPQLKYVVMDWVDTYGRVYFIPRNCEGFDENLREVEKFIIEFPTDNGTWKAGIIICEIKNKM